MNFKSALRFTRKPKTYCALRDLKNASHKLRCAFLKEEKMPTSGAISAFSDYLHITVDKIKSVIIPFLKIWYWPRSKL